MKILFWIAPFVLTAVIQVLLANIGIMLGALPIVIIFFVLFEVFRRIGNGYDDRSRRDIYVCSECGFKDHRAGHKCPECGAADSMHKAE